MKIRKIEFTLEPWYYVDHIQLRCTLFIAGREEGLCWHEVVEDSDFVSRFDYYFNYMKGQIKAKVLTDLLKKKRREND